MQKMVLLRAEKGPGVPVRHRRHSDAAGGDGPALSCQRWRAKNIVGKEAWRSVRDPEASGDAEGPELHGINA